MSDAPSLDTLVAAAGFDRRRGVQVVPWASLAKTDPAHDTLVLLEASSAPSEAPTPPATALQHYPATAVALLLQGSDAPAETTVGALRGGGPMPPSVVAVALPAIPASDVAFAFRGLRGVIACLRDPEHGCPWDLEQTHQSLRPHLLEEAYEVLDALDRNDIEALCEELGDLLMQVVLHAQVAQDAGAFTMDDVSEGIRAKLIRRHPHVFADVTAETADEVAQNWEQIKARERQEAGDTPAAPRSALDGVPASLPALARAQKLTGRAARNGWAWPTDEMLLDKVAEEVREIATAPADELAGEFGDLVFALADYARRHGVDLEDAVRETGSKFARRFAAVEALLGADGLAIADVSHDELLRRWDAVKGAERRKEPRTHADA